MNKLIPRLKSDSLNLIVPLMTSTRSTDQGLCSFLLLLKSLCLRVSGKGTFEKTGQYRPSYLRTPAVETKIKAMICPG